MKCVPTTTNRLEQWMIGYQCTFYYRFPYPGQCEKVQGELQSFTSHTTTVDGHTYVNWRIGIKGEIAITDRPQAGDEQEKI